MPIRLGWTRTGSILFLERRAKGIAMKDFTVVFSVGFVLILVVIGAMHLLRKRIPAPITEQQQNTLLGPFSFLATLYAFLLGFIVVTLWHNFNDVSRVANAEAETVVVIYRLSEGLPGGDAVQKILTEYTRSVKEDEWPQMATGETSKTTEAIYEGLWREVRNLAPKSTEEQALFSELVHQISELSRYRRERILHIMGGMPDVMWWALLAGGLLLLIGLYFLSIGNRRVQIMFDGIVIGMMLLMLYLAVELNRPFQGSVRVSPKAFEVVESKLHNSEHRP
jgi:hypothetical protein